MEAVDTPDVRDVTVEEGQPLTFTASFDTRAAVRARRLRDVSLHAAVGARRRRGRRPGAAAAARSRGAVRAGRRPRRRSRRHRSTVDLERTDPSGKTDKHDDVNIELGAKANPPGFDEQLLGLEPGATKTFPIHYPADYTIAELADTDVDYTVTVKALKRRVLPELDDEFAKDLGEFETLDALRARVREDLEHEARHAAERDVRARADEAARRAGALRGAAVARRARARSARSRTSRGG